MARLTANQLGDLYDAAIGANLAEQRDRLLAGIDAKVTSTSEVRADSSLQLHSDLRALNAAPPAGDGRTPLEQWLQNAVSLVEPAHAPSLQPWLDISRSAEPSVLRFIHLADLWFGQRTSRFAWNRENVVGRLIHDARELARELGPPHLILIAGDIASSGRADEYAQASAWLDHLASATGVDRTNIFVVPGNHDVDRSRDEGALRAHLDLLRGNVSELDVALVADAARAALVSRFEAYLNFARLYGAAGDVSYREVIDSGLGEVEIVGLNTALISADGRESRENLALGNGQIETISGDGRLLLVLQHHPPEWLSDGDRESARLATVPHLLLTGHIHSGGPRNPVVNGRLGAGSLDTSGKAPRFVYSWNELSLSLFTHRPRAWSAHKQAFVPNDDELELDQDGAKRFSLTELSPPLRSSLERKRHEALRRHYQTGSLVIVTGPAVSSAAGLPTPARFAELLADRARARRADAATMREISRLIDRGETVEAISAARDFLGKTEFVAVIEKLLDDHGSELPDLAIAIASLAPLLRAVINTSLDHVIERAFGGRWPTFVRTLPEPKPEHFVLALNGSRSEPDTWVVTREDHERADPVPPPGALLFVGFEPSDESFDLTRRRLAARERRVPTFVLVPAKALTPRRLRRLEAEDVHVLAFEHSPEERHLAEANFVRSLAVSETPEAGVKGRTLDELVEQLAGMGIIEPTSRPPRPRSELFARFLRAAGDRTAFAKLRNAIGVRVVLGLKTSGSFVFALDATQLSTELIEELTEREASIAASGGKIVLLRLGRGRPEATLWTTISIRAELEASMRDLLRGHAQKIALDWTQDDEHLFVMPRAKSGEGEVGPFADLLDRAAKKHHLVLVLGDAGSGKSTQLRRRAAMMAKAFLEDPDRAPAPILIPLLGVRPDALDVFEVLGPTWPIALLRLAVAIGMVVPLLDGLDEMGPGPAHARLDELLEDVAAGFGRMVVSSRAVGLRAAAAKASPSLEILPFDRSEVIDFVGRATATSEDARAVMEWFQSYYDANELAQSPYLLRMIIKSGSWSAGALPENLGAYFAGMIEAWLSKPSTLATEVASEKRLAFARALARRDGHAAFEELALTAEELHSLAVEQSFFIIHDRRTNRYEFAHRSFREYFAALDITMGLEQGDLTALDATRVQPEVVRFLREGDDWPHHLAMLRDVLTSRYRARISENALLCVYKSARAKHGAGEDLARALDELRGAQLAGADLSELDLAWISLP